MNKPESNSPERTGTGSARISVPVTSSTVLGGARIRVPVTSSTIKVEAGDYAILSSDLDQSPLTADKLQAEFDTACHKLTSTAKSAKKQIVQGLLEVKSILSQNGADYVRRQPGCKVPTWTEFLKQFIQDGELGVSMRTVQRWLSPANGNTSKQRQTPKKRPFTINGRNDRGVSTEAPGNDCNDRGMLLGLIMLIEQGADMVTLRTECDIIRAIWKQSGVEVQ